MPTVPPFTTADPNSYLALGMQSALGTPQVTPAKLRFAKYISGNSHNVDPLIVDLREGGDGLDFGTSYKAREVMTGQLVAYARPEIIGQLFQLVPGGATWDAASLSAGHIFHDNHASMPYGTLAVQHPGSTLVQLLSDLRFTGLTIEMAQGAPIKVSAPFVALTYGASFAALTPTYYDLASPGSDSLWLYHANPSILFDGAADTTIERAVLSLRYGTEEIQAQSIDLDDLAILSRDWDFTCERRYQSPSMYQKIAYGTGTAIVPTSSVPTSSFSAFWTYPAPSAAPRILGVQAGLISMRYDNLTELDPDGRTVKESLSGKPMHGATSAVTLTLKNGHASAYAP